MTLKEITNQLEEWKSDDEDERGFLLVTYNGKNKDENISGISGGVLKIVSSIASSAKDTQFKGILQTALQLAELQQGIKN